MKKIQGPKLASPSTASKAPVKAEKSAPPVKAKELSKPGFPRSAWADPAKLAKSIETAHDTQTHPRLKHARPTKDPIGGEPTRPPIAMRYGLRPIDPGQPPAPPVKPPPIAMRYGLRPIEPGQPPQPPVKPPPIAMRYGLRPIDPGQPPAPPVKPPPIAMRYGLRPTDPTRPTDPPVKPPPIAMRYGLVMPNRPGIPTSPRRGHSVD